MKTKKIKIIVIVGPTATGKSDLAVRIARDIAKKTKGTSVGEIISADSRQVYKDLDIGTGKITSREMKGVRHHLLDVADPRISANSLHRYSVETWRTTAEKAIAEIHARGNMPIIAGGTGFYIEALVDGIILPDVPPNPALRRKLSKKSVDELFNMLQKLDQRRARDMAGNEGRKTRGKEKLKANGDSKNPHRLIRAIEIATALGTVPEIARTKKSASPYDPMFIGLTLPPDVLKKKIAVRLEKRIKSGMITEARNLHGKGLSFKRMEELGLEYRYLARYLQGKLSKKELTENLKTEIWHYARRQMAWFRRDKRIRWHSSGDYKKILRTHFENVRGAMVPWKL